MKELRTPKGQRYWGPTHPNDRALLARAEGAQMRGTTLPSGWKSPDTEQIVKSGALYEVAPTPAGEDG